MHGALTCYGRNPILTSVAIMPREPVRRSILNPREECCRHGVSITVRLPQVAPLSNSSEGFYGNEGLYAGALEVDRDRLIARTGYDETTCKEDSLAWEAAANEKDKSVRQLYLP